MMMKKKGKGAKNGAKSDNFCKKNSAFNKLMKAGGFMKNKKY